MLRFCLERYAPVDYAAGFEFGSGQGARWFDSDTRAQFAFADDLGFQVASDLGDRAIVDADARLRDDRERIEDAFGLEHDLKLVAERFDTPDDFLHYAGKELQAADVQHVVGAAHESAHGPCKGPPASASRGVESGEIADEKTKLRRSFRIEI